MSGGEHGVCLAHISGGKYRFSNVNKSRADLSISKCNQREVHIYMLVLQSRCILWGVF